MAVAFRPVPETQDFTLRVAVSIAGSSGTGKTYSACLMARGLCGDKGFAFIDTENKRALHYRNDFPEMRHFDFGPEIDGKMIGFPPERWIALLDQIEAMGVGAVVIDSFSHAWEGIGGVLELQEQEVEAMARGDAAKAARVGMLAWAKVKPRYRRLIERIVQAKIHVIICIRAKPVMQEGFGDKKRNSRDTKLRRADLPWDIASDRDLVFEMTASMLMVPERPGEPILLKCPDHFRSVFPGHARVSQEMGTKMAEWAEYGGHGGQDRHSKELIDSARAAARGGKEALQTWWRAHGREDRAIVDTIMDELKDTARRADETNDDLFHEETTEDQEVA